MQEEKKHPKKIIYSSLQKSFSFMSVQTVSQGPIFTIKSWTMGDFAQIELMQMNV